MSKSRNILLYGDVDLRYTDGSAVWLISMARALTLTNSHVTLLLKSPLGKGGLFNDLARVEGLKIIDDFTTKQVRGPRYRPYMAARRIDSLVTEYEIDIVVCRGFEICREVAQLSNAAPRLWAYMTDIPQSASEMTTAAKAGLTAIARNSRRIFAQTDDAREFLEYYIPEARRKTILLPPMLPDESKIDARGGRHTDVELGRSPLRIVYAGKFARRWNTLEMCDLPRYFAERGVDLELTMIGDKFQGDPQDSTWATRMKMAVTESPGVHWIDGLSREDTLREVALHHVGIAWRSHELDSSHELSTKLLEYMACGVPPLVNRSAMHERLLGPKYPLFVDDGDVHSSLERVINSGEATKGLRTAVQRMVKPYRMSMRGAMLEEAFLQAEREVAGLKAAVPLQIELFTSEIFAELVDSTLGQCPGVTTHRNTNTHDLPQLVRNSLIITDTANIFRLGNTGRPILLLWDRTDQMNTRPADLNIAGALVADPSLRKAAAWWARLPNHQVYALPTDNRFTVDRPKVPSACHAVGATIEPGAARNVREAHSVLSKLRAHDRRFSLHLFIREQAVATLDPWDRELFLDALEDLARDPTTAGAWSIAQDGRSDTWLREIGWLLYSNVQNLALYVGTGGEFPNVTPLPFSVNDEHEDAIDLSTLILRATLNEDERDRKPHPIQDTACRGAAIDDLARLLKAAEASTTEYMRNDDVTGHFR